MGVLVKNVWVFCMFLKKVRKVLVFYRYGGGGAQGLRLGEGGAGGRVVVVGVVVGSFKTRLGFCWW